MKVLLFQLKMLAEMLVEALAEMKTLQDHLHISHTFNVLFFCVLCIKNQYFSIP